MKKIISASRRTDIPAFYLQWFMDAVKKRELNVRNPFYPAQMRPVNLTPDSVEWIVFWSRNYGSFLKYKKFFASYRLFFHFTILTRHPLLEPYGISPEKACRQAERLAGEYGADRIVWRYDPLVFWQYEHSIQTNFDLKHFEELCCKLGRIGIYRCYFSVVTPYKKFLQRWKQRAPGMTILEPDHPRVKQTICRMRSVAAAYRLQLFSCCNDTLVGNGIKKGRCIDGRLLNAIGDGTKVSVAKAPTRTDCGCTKSVDIGDYLLQPCAFGCIYCYANPLREGREGKRKNNP